MPADYRFSLVDGEKSLSFLLGFIAPVVILLGVGPSVGPNLRILREKDAQKLIDEIKTLADQSAIGVQPRFICMVPQYKSVLQELRREQPNVDLNYIRYAGTLYDPIVDENHSAILFAYQSEAVVVVVPLAAPSEREGYSCKAAPASVSLVGRASGRGIVVGLE
ncbi:hypothetical protein [Chelatococcus reniformis]|uniref:hypothetical protein n=1 Tax=Chelatococcus reniformis TaxID=1494448 RepID=UPI00166CB13C|nr:hypothetical protein [Chelatococcus reniformis]